MSKILFIQTAFLGDAILTLPAIQKLKESNPDSSIDVLCIPATKTIFNNSSVINETIVFDKKQKQKSIINTIKFANFLRLKNYDRIYSSHRSYRTALLVLLSQVRETYGFDNSAWMHVYRNLIKYRTDRHEVQRNLDLIGFDYDVADWKIKPELSVSTEIINKIESFSTQHRLANRFIAVAPGSVWNTKKYPVEYFEIVINHFVGKNTAVVLIGGEKDKELCGTLAGKFLNKVIDASGLFSVVESIEILKRARLLITNDSAPTHMGMAADIKVLTIYCSTIKDFGFFPFNTKSVYLSYDNLKCKPCGIHGYDYCPIKTFECARKLLPEQVIAKAEEMISD